MDTPEEQRITWTFPEYERRDRSPGWYLTAGIVGLGLFIFAVLSSNFLFASIIVFLVFIYALHHYRHPLTVDFSISQEGVALQQRHFPWKEIKTFWLIYEPPEVKNLYFEFKGMRPRLRIPLGDQNPLAVREALLPYLEEDLEKENEPITDAMGRAFKL